MGIREAEQLSQKKRKGVEHRERKFRRNGGTAGADWLTVDPRRIALAIEALARMGGAIRFGYTSDGGAYAVGIYGDGDKPYTEYLKPDEDVGEFLRELVAAFGDDRLRYFSDNLSPEPGVWG